MKPPAYTVDNRIKMKRDALYKYSFSCANIVYNFLLKDFNGQ